MHVKLPIVLWHPQADVQQHALRPKEAMTELPPR
jgi:hypothetical protein